MAKITKRDEIKQLIEEIEAKKGLETYETQTGIFYVIDKDDYYFHLYFVYGGNPPTYKEPTVDEIYYNLKDRICWLRRNDKELVFSEDNIRKSFGYMNSSGLSFLETDGNRGLYQTAFNKLGKMYSENTAMVSRFLVRLMNEYPVLENLSKAGFDINLCFNDITNKTTMNIGEAFGFTLKSQLKLYKMGVGVNPVFQSNDRLSARYIRDLTEENIQSIFSTMEYAKSLDKKYGLRKSLDVYKNMTSCYGRFDDSTWRNFINDLKKFYEEKSMSTNIDERRLIEYLYYECDVRQGITSPGGAISFYKDYVRMSLSLGKKFEKYPKSLRMRHDIASKYFSLIRSFGQDNKFKESCESVKHLEGRIGNSGYSIVVPSTPEDIIDEGEQLSHCVKSYIEAIANGDCQIVFLRKNKELEIALYTVEIRQNSIVQFAGYQNCDPDEEAKKALTKWAESFNLIEHWLGQTT